MKRFAVFALGLVARVAVDAHVKVIAMRVPFGRLYEHGFGAIENALRRVATTAVGKQTLTNRTGDKNVLHARIRVGHQARDKVPVAFIIKAQPLIGRACLPVAVKLRERKGLERATGTIENVKRQIHVTTVLVRAVSVNVAARLTRELTDRELRPGIATRHTRCCALQHLNKLEGPKEMSRRGVLGRTTNRRAHAKLDTTLKSPLPRCTHRATALGQTNAFLFGTFGCATSTSFGGTCSRGWA